ncbi:PDZ domain-containing protein [Paenibacillus sp. YYML68]|uniref:PDZ domain-containing protein n=1 Tax=Paenibacillus sp. YYML68 TaxID=2909250 RepID=UPI002491504A|nr:PDZ domain-containing protein [Paenibacillus sp. YYML68]
MSWVQTLGLQWLEAILQLLLHPFYYVGILVIVLQYRRQIALERRLFSTKLHSLLSESWRTVMWGFFGGLVASALMAVIGATVQLEAVLLLWLVSLLIALVRVRYMCWAYAVGVLGMLHAILSSIPGVGSSAEWQWLTGPILAFNAPSMLALVAVLHLAEAVYVRTLGTRLSTPLFVEGKRGRMVGAYQLQGFWPMALFLIVPLSPDAAVGGAGAGAVSLPWSPLLGGEMWQNGWMIIGFPVMVGFTELTMSRVPKDKARMSSTLLLGYSGAVLLLALLAALAPVLTFWLCLLAVLLHEGMIVFSRRDEEKRAPIYVQDGKGLNILAVLPGSPAEELGLRPGEVISKVNGVPIRTKQELHQAMQLNSAYCRLEILDYARESRFLKRAVYSGDHHQLGIILAPDEDVLYYVDTKPLSFWSYFRRKLTGLLRNEKQIDRGM